MEADIRCGASEWLEWAADWRVSGMRNENTAVYELVGRTPAKSSNRRVARLISFEYTAEEIATRLKLALVFVPTE